MTRELGNGTDGRDGMGSAMRISLLVALSNNALLTLLGPLLLVAGEARLAICCLLYNA